MKLLLVNPNMTQAVTDRVAAEARRVASPGTEVTAVTGAFGVAVVSTEAEASIAAHASLDLLAEHHESHDAAIVAMSFDVGVVAARGLLPIPVLGITGSAIHTACLLGRRFGMIVSGAVSVPLYLDLLDASGSRDRMAAMEIVDIASAAAYLDTAALEARIADAARRLAERPEIEAIVLCGAAMAGLAYRLRDDLTLPLIDGVAAATTQAEALVRLGLRPKRRPVPLAASLAPVGVGAKLARLLGAATA
jgi:allantoin racemase